MICDQAVETRVMMMRMTVWMMLIDTKQPRMTSLIRAPAPVSALFDC